MQVYIQEHTKTPNESVQRVLKALQGDFLTLNYGKAVDKLTQYQFFKDNEIEHPEWTTCLQTAEQWLDDGYTVLGRELLKSGKGAGIKILTDGFDDLGIFKVFTKYIKKKREFRVNLFQHKFVNVREKLKQGPGSNYIRNPDNGWHTYHPKPIPDELLAQLKELVVKASQVSDSDFIGVDVGYNELYKKLFVLEVNSGPAIEGSSVNDFVKAITTHVESNT